MTVDGIYFRIYEPHSFDKGYYSNKFNKAGLTYEIGLNSQTGDIFWAFDGFRAGVTNLQMTLVGLHAALPLMIRLLLIKVTRENLIDTSLLQRIPIIQ